MLLGQPRALICKGEGGEFERIPDRTVELNGVSAEATWLESWEPLLNPGQQVRQERLNLNHFRQVWEGEVEDAYGELAVIGTLALVLRALDLEASSDSAHEQAARWWRERHQHSSVREAV